MDRKEFIQSIGAGAALVLAFPCINGCSSEEVPTFPTGEKIDFTIDLTTQEANPLLENGGFIRKNEVVIAKNLEGNFVAASQVCSHQQTLGVQFTTANGGVFRCSTHGAEFSQTGNPQNSITNNPLKIYQTQLQGDILRIYES